MVLLRKLIPFGLICNRHLQHSIRRISTSSVNRCKKDKDNNVSSPPPSSKTSSTSDSKEVLTDDFSVENERRIAEILEYYNQYEKEIIAGGYQDPEMEPLGHISREDALKQQPVVDLVRGRTGVFDLHEVIAVLRNERARDICCIKIPPEICYTDHIIVCTAFNVRHSNAICQYFYWLHKRKKSEYDRTIAKVEKNTTWAALDLGNVVVHVMTEDMRRRYDIDMLWAVGPEFDDLTVARSEVDVLEEKFQTLQSDIAWLKNVKVKSENA